jgi:hypothetical protein
MGAPSRCSGVFGALLAALLPACAAASEPMKIGVDLKSVRLLPLQSNPNIASALRRPTRRP